MTIEKAILPIKINELVSLIAEKKKLDTADSMSYLYSSQFYKRLQNTESKWWYMSGINLYKELEKEKHRLQITDRQLQKEKMFYIFCAENFRILKNMEASEVLALFQKYDVYNFTTANYDVLHTQGEEYILNEITTYIKNQNKSRK
ncbi:MAG: DUF3791 domain-containing protein [Paludibacter sp.]